MRAAGANAEVRNLEESEFAAESTSERCTMLRRRCGTGCFVAAAAVCPYYPARGTLQTSRKILRFFAMLAVRGTAAATPSSAVVWRR